MNRIYATDRPTLDLKILEAFEKLERLGWTQRKIAEYIGVTRPAINFLKHGTQGKGKRQKLYERPAWQVLILAEMAGMSPDEFGLEDHSTRLLKARSLYVFEVYPGNGAPPVLLGYKYGITNELNDRKTGINQDKPYDHVLKCTWIFEKDGQAYFCEKAVELEFGRCIYGEYVFRRKQELIAFIQSVADFQRHSIRKS